jgi:hypothetical protein
LIAIADVPYVVNGATGKVIRYQPWADGAQVVGFVRVDLDTPPPASVLAAATQPAAPPANPLVAANSGVVDRVAQQLDWLGRDRDEGLLSDSEYHQERAFVIAQASSIQFGQDAQSTADGEAVLHDELAGLQKLKTDENLDKDEFNTLRSAILRADSNIHQSQTGSSR